MTNSSLAHPAQSTTREQRGIALYRDHADDIRHEDGVWLVPSQHDATTVYEVVIGRRESCECEDHGHWGYACKHVYAATIAKAKTAPCAMCGDRFRYRDLTEVVDDHLSCFEGDLLCRSCARDHGVA